MKYKNVLLLYKKSAYRIYFENKESTFKNVKGALLKRELKEFKKAHNEHYESLSAVARTLITYGIRFSENCRGRSIDYSKYDLIITVGGDGTFLEAARKITNQTIIGINSSPTYSVGRYCVTTAQTFESVLRKIIANKYKKQELHRIKVRFDNGAEPLLALNDILVCHANPAALYRYTLQINTQIEEQRSSGVWISTASGSSGAICSSGGKTIGPYLKKFQYMPRELYQGLFPKYKLTGKVLEGRSVIKVTNLARKSFVFADGAHHKTILDYGDTVSIRLASNPVRMIV